MIYLQIIAKIFIVNIAIQLQYPDFLWLFLRHMNLYVSRLLIVKKIYDYKLYNQWEFKHRYMTSSRVL